MNQFLLTTAAAIIIALTLNFFYTRYQVRRQARQLFTPHDLIVAHPESNPAQRVLPLPGAFNVRDIGGYRNNNGQLVRWQQVYRAGTLSYLSEKGLAQLQQWGIRLVCDLRTTHEATTMPAPLPDGVRYQHVPLHEKRDGRGRVLATLTFRPHRINDLVLYGYITLMIERRATLFARLLRLIADPANRPILLHCTAGKDRTGLTIALLLSLLGVPEATILADFSLSNLFYDEVRNTIQGDANRLAIFGLKAGNLHPLLVAHPDTLRATLAYVRGRYGSVEHYLRQRAGLEAQVITQLRQQLLVDEGAEDQVFPHFQ